MTVSWRLAVVPSHDFAGCVKSMGGNGRNFRRRTNGPLWLPSLAGPLRGACRAPLATGKPTLTSREVELDGLIGCLEGDVMIQAPLPMAMPLEPCRTWAHPYKYSISLGTSDFMLPSLL